MSSAIPAIASTALAFVGGYIVAKTMGSQQESSKNKQDSNAKQTSSSKKEKEQEQSTSKKEEVEVETKFSDSGEYKMVDYLQNLKLFVWKMIELFIEFIRIVCITIYILIFKFPKMVFIILLFFFIIIFIFLFLISFLFFFHDFRFWL